MQSRIDIRRWLNAREGVAMVEFALILPLLALLFLLGVELSRYIQMNQKVDNAARTMVDLLTQNLNLTKTSVDSIISTLPGIITPYDSDGYGVVITSIKLEEDETQPNTLWQIKGGTLSNRASRVSQGRNHTPTLNNIVMMERDQIVTVEVFLGYKPLIQNGFTESLLGLSSEGVYKLNIARPRYGAFEFEPR